MRFIDFRLSGFAQHHNTFISFVDGLPNLIIGPNESGKSQLLSGMVGTIFGLTDVERFAPWHGEPNLCGDLLLDADGQEIRIVRHFAKNHVEVIQDGSSIYQGRGLTMRRSAEDERYQRLLGNWLGFTDMDIFRGVVFIEQDQLNDDQLSKRAVEIKRIISGSREADYDTAIKELDESLDKLKRRPSKRNDREIELLEAEIADLQHRAQTASRFEAEAISLEEAQRATREKLEHVREQQSNLSTLLENFGRHRRLRDQIEQQSKELQRIDRDLRNAAEMTARQRQLETDAAELRVSGIPDPDAVRKDQLERIHAKSDINKIEQEISDIEAEIQRLQTITAVPPSRQRASGLNVPLLAAGVALALGSLVMGLAINPLALVGLLFGTVLIVIALLARPTTASEHPGLSQMQRRVAEERRSDLLNDLEKARANFQAIDDRCQRWLSASGETDLDRLISRLDRYRDVSARLSEIRTRKADDPDALQAENARALQEAAITRTRIEQLEEEHPELHDLTPERASELQRNRDQLGSDENRLDQQLNDIRVRRGVLQSTTADDAAALAVLIREKQRDLQRKRHLATALELAIATMESCVHDFQEHALDPVAAQAGELVQQITDGRYDRVAIDQLTMMPSVRFNDSREIDIETLSRGTRDQVYLAVRVGLVDALSGGRKLPIILDDPCVHFDDERREAAFHVMSEIARQRQVIILTKDESYTRWLQPVLRLERHESARPLNVGD